MCLTLWYCQHLETLWKSTQIRLCFSSFSEASTVAPLGAGAVGSAPCPKWTVHSWRRPAVLHQLNMLEKTNNKWQQAKTVCKLMWLSWNRDTSKSSISMGFSLTKTIHFGDPPFMETPDMWVAKTCWNLLKNLLVSEFARWSRYLDTKRSCRTWIRRHEEFVIWVYLKMRR